MEAIVDNIDFDYLNQWSWGIVEGSSTQIYAARGERTNGIYSKILMHRVVALRMGLTVDGLQVDHEDRYGLNNQRLNIRVGTQSFNQHNVGPRKDSTTGVRGVHYIPELNKYRARIQIHGSRMSLGLYDTIEAAEAAQQTALKRFIK